MKDLEKIRKVEKGMSRQLRICQKYILIMITVVLLAFAMNPTCFANNEDENRITNDFELSSRSSINNEIQYGVYVKKGDENSLLSIKAADYNLPSNLYDYKDNIRLRVTYLQDNHEVLDCKVINFKTGEIIEDLSEKNINKLFNIEYGKNITEKNWVDIVKLSELNQNDIYKYTASSTTQFPKIENDIGKNCIIYIKGKNDNTYEKEINMCKEISGSSISISFNEYNSGETFNIMYKVIENEELLKLIKEDEVIYLSKYNDGDVLGYQFEKYIYNDTEKNITIHIKDTAFGVEKSDSIVIEKGKIYGFDWFIDSASISYAVDNAEQNGNTEDKNDNEEQNGQTEDKNVQKGEVKEENNNKDKDDTIVQSSLPKAGMNNLIFFVIIAFISISVVIRVKLKKYEDIR